MKTAKSTPQVGNHRRACYFTPENTLPLMIALSTLETVSQRAKGREL